MKIAAKCIAVVTERKGKKKRKGKREEEEKEEKKKKQAYIRRVMKHVCMICVCMRYVCMMYVLRIFEHAHTHKRIHKFYKNLEATSKFKAPEG
jgi:hypothetical protein